MDDVRGFRVAVTAHRRVREQTMLFEWLGAAVVALPLVVLEPTPGDETLDVVRRVLDRPPEVAVFTTGAGTCRLFAIADAAGLGDALEHAVDSGHVIARGPKATGALAARGVHVDWSPPNATGREVDAHLARLGGSPRCFLQVDGTLDDTPDGVLGGIGRRLAGPGVLRVRTYRCSPSPARRDLPAALAEVDAVTFTSPVPVAGLRALPTAEREAVVRALAGMVTVAMGPVTAGALAQLGVDRAVIPDAWRLGSMVRATAAALVDRSVPLGAGVERRGGSVLVGDEVRPLSAGERRLLRALVEGGGAVLGKPALGRAASVGSDDPHAVEAVVARLRRRLGPAAQVVETVPRRGYRLASSSARAAPAVGAGPSPGSLPPATVAGRGRPSQP